MKKGWDEERQGVEFYNTQKNRGESWKKYLGGKTRSKV